MMKAGEKKEGQIENILVEGMIQSGKSERKALLNCLFSCRSHFQFDCYK